MANTNFSYKREHRATARIEFADILPKPFQGGFYAKVGYYNRLYGNDSKYGLSATGMDYRQHVAFVDAAMLGSAFERKLGYSIILNAEYVKDNGSEYKNSESSPIGYSEFNVNPTVGLSWYHKYGSLGISYTRSVKRPSVSQLSTYTDVRNPYSIYTGNPNLKGQSTNMFSATSDWRAGVKWIRNIQLSCAYSFSNNAISRIVSVGDDGVTTSTYCNLGKTDSGSASLRVGLSPHNTLDLNLFASYSIARSVLPSGKSTIVSRPSGYVSLNWHPKWFELAGTFSLRPTTSSVQSATLNLEPLAGLSLSRYFKKPHFGMSLSIEDILHSGGSRQAVLYLDGSTQYIYAERLGRTFRVTAYWRFGKFRQSESVSVKAYDMD